MNNVMLNNELKLLGFFSILLLLLASCVKDVDFSQAENLSLTPTVAASIVYTEVEASQFSENGIEIETVKDSVANIEIFNDQFIKDNLIRAELVFESSNTINRAFNLQVDFFNDAEELQHTLSFNALESSTGSPVVTEYIETFEDDSMEALKTISQMVITLSLYPSSDGTILNESSTGEISLKSKGIFYFNINI